MKISLKTLLFALILGASTAYAAGITIIISDPHLTTLAEIDFSTATSIIIDNCPALETLDGLIAPMATTIHISECPNLTSLGSLYVPLTNALFLQVFVRQNLTRQQNARWSGHRAAWCGAVARCARARLLAARDAARAKAAAEAELAAAEAEAGGGEEAGPAKLTINDCPCLTELNKRRK